MDANSTLAVSDVDVKVPDLLRFQIRKRPRNLHLLFRKPIPNGADVSTSSEEIVRSNSEREIWLRVVGVVFLLMKVSRGEMNLGVRIRVSSRPQHPRVLCFLLHRQWTMECSCRV
ncbi:hypothetical protein Taro_007386 [Colocasia esculenta]|uniref:Uncharacterized protein n=1 Tax=Colocasia esculenta TaxID=4460 RepID=A0A843TUW1_COLES|nr:hypothetical protein [Colocasia esculenta]